MRDRRVVDDLTIEELEEVLRIKKREARSERLQRMAQRGRRPDDVSLPEAEMPRAEQQEERPILSYESFVHTRRAGGRYKRNSRDRLLLAVEILAVLGLVAIFVFAGLTLRNLNRESSDAQAGQIATLPDPTATPLFSVVVLPGGHTPPTSPQGAQPNYDEVPAHLRPLVEQQFSGPVIVPTSSPGLAIRLRIPAIGVDAPIVQGDGWEQLQKGVGQHIGSANPGQPGNGIFSAHNDIYGEIFRHLDQLEEGDEIIVETQRQSYVYRVSYWRTVSPTEVSVLEQTQESIVTLISCYPYLVNNERIVVIGELSQ